MRHDVSDKVTGKNCYRADTVLPGLLYGAILRILTLGSVGLIRDGPEAAPTVRAVVTAADFPAPGSPPEIFQMLNLMARKKVHYKGHAAAAVAAFNQHDAQEALWL